MYRANLETRNFSFDAYGDTEINAKTAMARAISEHAGQYGLNEAKFWDDVSDDIQITEIHSGSAYRDGQHLITTFHGDLREQVAIMIAEGNNGGEWSTHYTEEQKNQWRYRADSIIDMIKSN